MHKIIFALFTVLFMGVCFSAKHCYADGASDSLSKEEILESANHKISTYPYPWLKKVHPGPFDLIYDEGNKIANINFLKNKGISELVAGKEYQAVYVVYRDFWDYENILLLIDRKTGNLLSTSRYYKPAILRSIRVATVLLLLMAITLALIFIRHKSAFISGFLFMSVSLLIGSLTLCHVNPYGDFTTLLFILGFPSSLFFIFQWFASTDFASYIVMLVVVGVQWFFIGIICWKIIQVWKKA